MKVRNGQPFFFVMLCLKFLNNFQVDRSENKMYSAESVCFMTPFAVHSEREDVPVVGIPPPDCLYKAGLRSERLVSILWDESYNGGFVVTKTGSGRKLVNNDGHVVDAATASV